MTAVPARKDGLDLLFAGAILLLLGYGMGTTASYLTFLPSSVAGAVFGVSIVGFASGVAFWVLAFVRLRRDYRAMDGHRASGKDGLDAGVGGIVALVIALVVAIVGAFAPGIVGMAAATAGFAGFALVGLLFAGCFLRLREDLPARLTSAGTSGLLTLAYGSLLLAAGSLLLAVLTPFPAFAVSASAAPLGVTVGGVIVALSVLGPLLWVIGGYQLRKSYRQEPGRATAAIPP